MDETAEEKAAREAVEAEEARLKEEREAEEEAQRVADEEAETQRTESGDENSETLLADDEATEDVILIGDEEPPSSEDEAKAPEWVKELRKNQRELAKRNRELEDQLKATQGAEMKPAPLGQKPKLEDFDFDSDKFEAALTKWHDDKRAADDEARKKQEEESQATKAWQAKLAAYNEAKTKLKVRGADEAEAVVKDLLTVTQQGIILQGAEDAALVIVALGKNTKKAKELAAIKDPVKFAFAVAKLETQLKIAPKKVPPKPEERVSGNTSSAGVVDSQLERLRAEAEKTGNYSKVNQYKRDKRLAKRTA